MSPVVLHDVVSKIIIYLTIDTTTDNITQDIARPYTSVARDKP